MSNPIQFRANDKDYREWLQIKEYIIKKHGKLHSVVAREAINLMMCGLEHTSSNTHTHRKTKRTYNSYQQLLFSMQDYKQARDTELAEIIDNACGRGGKDLRTFRKNKQFLLEDDIIVLNTSVPSRPGKQIYNINQKKLLFKLRSFSGTIEDYTIKSTTKTRQPIKVEIERPQTQKRGHKAEIDKILAEVGAVIQ